MTRDARGDAISRPEDKDGSEEALAEVTFDKCLCALLLIATCLCVITWTQQLKKKQLGSPVRPLLTLRLLRTTTPCKITNYPSFFNINTYI